MRVRPAALTTQAWVVLAGCTAGGAVSETGSPGKPLLLSCGQESFSDPPPPGQPQPGDLAIGPLYIANGRLLSTVNPAGVVAATYRSCAGRTGFFAQSFTFLHGQTRGCVPLDVRVADGRQVLHATVSLGGGACAE